ncbi:MAG: BrnT family toxin [Gammaproteobacteria bacterium]
MDYTEEVEFEWDSAKSEACFRTRRFDFKFATRAFADSSRVVRPDFREDYGECRFELMGAIENRLYVVVFTHRAGRVRIISARKANRREVARYANRTDENELEDAAYGEDWSYR